VLLRYKPLLVFLHSLSKLEETLFQRLVLLDFLCGSERFVLVGAERFILDRCGRFVKVLMRLFEVYVTFLLKSFILIIPLCMPLKPLFLIPVADDRNVDIMRDIHESYDVNQKVQKS